MIALHILRVKSNFTVYRFGNKLFRQIVGISIGTNCAPLVADCFFLFCYERDLMTSLSAGNQADIIQRLDI